MIRFIKILGAFWFVLLTIQMNAQELLSGLPSNELVAGKISKQPDNKSLKLNKETAVYYAGLPFFDDFKNRTLFADPSHWIGRSVFVNNSFGYLPPNQGVATFDALDSTGTLYPTASSAPFRADELTSVGIRLDSVYKPSPRRLEPKDSLYLSFYYQPQGYGNAPEEGDSLVLAFRVLTGDSIFSPIDSVWEAQAAWKTVWKTAGMSLSAFQKQYGKNFVQVMIPIRDKDLFYKGFQFRFYNYASIANELNPVLKSNVDEWNIDYVYLNKGRSAGDTTYRALAFSGESPSFLKHYLAMPYRQYRADPTNSLRPDFHLNIANLDRVDHQIHYRYTVTQRNGDFFYDYNGGICNLAPFYQFGFQDCNSSCSAAQACPPVNSLFSLDYDRDTTSYRIVHYISDSSVSPVLVDSMVAVQKFYNYFAYDDGSPELGYGVISTGSSVACQFNVNVPDTLRSVQIYFNKTSSTGAEYFNLMVWRDNNGKPGEVIYEQDNLVVKWEDGIYQFHNYMLDSPLLVSGTFYVGYQQQDQNLNIGFDANHDAQDKNFYSLGNDWYPSQFQGALMMRAVLGSALIAGISKEKTQEVKALQVYPNPNRGEFHFVGLELKAGQWAAVAVYNIYGSLVFQRHITQNKLDVGYLPTGLYVAKVQVGARLFSTKFLIRK